MKKQKLLLGAFCCLAGLLSACAGDDEGLTPGATGKGALRLSVQTETAFVTKATPTAVEEKYSDTENYNVALYDAETQEAVGQWGPDFNSYLPASPVTVEAGSYYVKAWMGNPDLPASTTDMYVEGTSQTVTVQPAAEGAEPAAQTLAVTCTPRSAKLTVSFAPEMDTYFSDYQAVIHTAALTAASDQFTWRKDASDPVYLKVADNEQITVDFAQTKLDGQAGPTVSKRYTLSPRQALNISVAPAQDSNGTISISITVDTTTNDVEQDIELPTDVTGQGGTTDADADNQ